MRKVAVCGEHIYVCSQTPVILYLLSANIQGGVPPVRITGPGGRVCMPVGIEADERGD